MHRAGRQRRTRQDIALQTARFLKSTKPNSVVKLKEPTRRQSWPSKLANRSTMPLKMRPTGLGHGVYKDDVDYFCGVWCIGRIYETRTGPAGLRWFWALHAPTKPGSMRISNQVATLEEAKAEFEASWKQWKAWAKLEEIGCL